METPVTKADILNVIKDVPADEFITGCYTNGIDKCCTIGHYNRLVSDDPTNYSLINCFKCDSIPGNLRCDIEMVNNENRDNIKETIIAFLSEENNSSNN